MQEKMMLYNLRFWDRNGVLVHLYETLDISILNVCWCFIINYFAEVGRSSLPSSLSKTFPA